MRKSASARVRTRRSRARNRSRRTGVRATIPGRFYGPTRLRDALARSRNLVTIRVMRQIGVGFTREYVLRFGLPKEHIPPDLTAALGTAQLTPLEMANGFAVFANGGSLVKPHLIDRILAADGSVLEETDSAIACVDCGTVAPRTRGWAACDRREQRAPAPCAPPMSAAACRHCCLSRSRRARSPKRMPGSSPISCKTSMRRGTGQRARALGRADIAGKTGTTNDGRDAWFSGFNPDLVATAWVGFDQERPLGPTKKARALRCRCGSISCARRSPAYRSTSCRCPTAS